ncbi:SoxR reducing system RseC family protein [Parahaliea mediterranea]|uniref:SoxR reducing system RseC family protein n=1 Tax=Parahaliea mediterranea TaxID=651086 RepID=A0A939DHL7_9GAMM|nr:SoxR reducing system RseC family protein [Parahaliea mediterranea]MBN7798178.1 SoxR reducing system RseC family protein [Parahaliea mediterranea]
MLVESGEVVAVEPGAVWVETLRRSTCNSCTAQKGCGHGLLNRVGAGRRHYIRVLPGRVQPAQCRVGDTVEIGLPETVILRGSLLVYLLPLLALLAGAALGGALWPQQQDLAALAGAGLGLFAGLLAVRLHAARHREDPALQPTLLSRRDTGAQAVELA